MNRLRIAWKMPALLLATAAAACVASVARAASLGRLPTSARWASRACSWWSRTVCAILGIRHRVEGAPHGAPFLVAANHLTYIDIWVLGALYSSIFVAKKEISRWPIFGWVARTAGTLFVDREVARDVVRVGRLMEAHLAAGVPLTVFPEGGTSPGDAVRPFMSSILEPAARAGVPCFAASISYETPGSEAPPTRTVCWTGGNPPFLEHLLGLMSLHHVEARVTFSREPVRSGDRKELARLLWEETSRTFVPVRRGAPTAERSGGGTRVALQSKVEIPSQGDRHAAS